MPNTNVKHYFKKSNSFIIFISLICWYRKVTKYEHTCKLSLMVIIKQRHNHNVSIQFDLVFKTVIYNDLDSKKVGPLDICLSMCFIGFVMHKCLIVGSVFPRHHEEIL